MRSSRLTVFISAIFLPHIIAISTNLPDWIDLDEDPALGGKNWNTDGEALQGGLFASVSSARSNQMTSLLMLLTLLPVTAMDMTWLLQTAQPS